MTITLRRSALGDGAQLLRAGLAVAVVDAVFGIVNYVLVQKLITTAQFFQSIASALLGRSAFHEGLPAVMLGALLHLTVALSWSAVYLVAVRRSARVARVARSRAGAVWLGVAFGAIIWLVMDFAVLPLTKAHHTPLASPAFLVQLIGHMVLLGPTITLLIEA